MLRSGNEPTLWDLNARRATLRLKFAPSPFFGSAFSPDSRYLAYGDTNQAIRVWDLAANRERIRFVTPGHGAMLRSLRFSPDNRLLASGGWDGLWLWSLETGGALHGPIQREGVNQVCFSADGKTLIAITDDGPDDSSIRFWNVATGQEVLSFAHAGMGDSALRSISAEYTAAQAELNPGGDLLILQDVQHVIHVIALPTLEEIDAYYRARETEVRAALPHIARFARARAEAMERDRLSVLRDPGAIKR